MCSSDLEKDLNKTSQVTLKSVYLVSTGKNLQEALQNSEKIIPEIENLKNQNIINQYTSVNSILISDSLQIERIKYWNKFWTLEKKENIKKNILKSGAQFKFKDDAFSSFFNLFEKEYKPVQKSELGNLYNLFILRGMVL